MIATSILACDPQSTSGGAAPVGASTAPAAALGGEVIAVVDGILKSEDGYNIVQVANRREKVERTFQQMKGSVIRKMKNDKLKELYEGYVGKLKTSASVEIDQAKVDGITVVPQKMMAPDISLGAPGRMAPGGMQNLGEMGRVARHARRRGQPRHGSRWARPRRWRLRRHRHRLWRPPEQRRRLRGLHLHPDRQSAGPVGQDGLVAVFELTPPADALGPATLRWWIGTNPGVTDRIRAQSGVLATPMTEEQRDAGLPEASLLWGRDELRPWRDEEPSPPAASAPPSAPAGCLKGGCDGWGQLDVMVYPDGSRHEGAWSGSSPVNYGVDRAADGRVTLAGFWSEGAVGHPAQPASYEALGDAEEVARALAPLCAGGGDLRRFLPADADEFSHAHPVTVPGVAARTTLWTPGSSDLRVEAGQLALLVDLTDQPGDPQRAIAACSGAFAGLAGAESSWRATSFRSPPCAAVLDEGAEEPAAETPPRVELTVGSLGDELVLRCGVAP